jgi:hypothetical protein
MADLLKVMQREMLHSEHAAQCFLEAKRRDRARSKKLLAEMLKHRPRPDMRAEDFGAAHFPEDDDQPNAAISRPPCGSAG